MTNSGLTLTNRGVVTGDSSLEEMYDLARRVDEDERFTSVWVGDSITAKPRLDALSLMSALAARKERVDGLSGLTTRRYGQQTKCAAGRCSGVSEQLPGHPPRLVPVRPRVARVGGGSSCGR